MIIMAEWGDKSQVATVLLSANQNPILVGFGAVLVRELTFLIIFIIIRDILYVAP